MAIQFALHRHDRVADPWGTLDDEEIEELEEPGQRTLSGEARRGHRYPGQPRRTARIVAPDLGAELAAAVGSETASELPHRRRLESALGVDLRHVRAHAGQESSAGVLGAAGARGAALPDTVVFADSTPELALIAHEVVHVLQHRLQDRAPAPASTDDLEGEAHQVTAAIARGGTARVRHVAATQRALWDRGRVIARVTLWTRPRGERRVVAHVPADDSVEVLGSDTPGWAFVEWHGQVGYVPVTSIRRDPDPGRCDDGWPRRIPPPPERPSIDWGFIYNFEGYHPEGEVPGGHSGVTVAHGFDLGHRGPAWLRRVFHANPSIVRTLSPFGPQASEAGPIVGDEARRRLQAHPIRLTDAECAIIDAHARHDHEHRAHRGYEAVTGESFAALAGPPQTVLVSITYHYGSITPAIAPLARAIAAGNWADAVRFLRSLTSHRSRRNAEANYLEAWALSQSLRGPLRW